jgi:hypothetical protein
LFYSVFFVFVFFVFFPFHPPKKLFATFLVFDTWQATPRGMGKENTTPGRGRATPPAGENTTTPGRAPGTRKKSGTVQPREGENTTREGKHPHHFYLWIAADSG